MTETQIPIGINGLQKIILLNNEYQQVFSAGMYSGRIMGVIYYGMTCLGGFDFAVIEGNATNMYNWGKFTNNEKCDLPVTYQLPPNFDFSIQFDYQNNYYLYARIISDNVTTVPIIVMGLFFSGSGYIGTNTYCLDYLLENTDGGGINIMNDVHMNYGIVNIGTDASSNHDINIGSDASGARIVTIGNNNSGSKVVIKGEIDIQDPLIGSITFNNPSVGTWSNISSVAKKVGKMCFISIKATFTATDTVLADTSYNFFSVTPTIDFTNDYITCGECLIDDGSLIKKGSCMINIGTADVKIIFYDSLVASDSRTVSCSISYLN
jgi:hypothetical protein